jgi:cell division septation protein DedD
MATFQTVVGAARAIQELQEAGYRAYSADVTLNDGRPAVGVFLGPYAQRAPAERDVERVREIPGYDSAHIVPIDPSELPAQP